MHDPATTPSRISQLLAAVDRPGDFSATGTVETATPAITVDRLRLSFPVPDAQARGLIELAELAPYGRGGETLVDPSVRKVWQIAAPRVVIGARWQRTLGAIVADAAHGLGVSGSVRAELYKLLVYDAGSFFVEHRDTEKVDCAQFRAFLASPTEASWSLKANEHSRRHLESIIEQHRIEVDRETLRTNPRTLVCRKNSKWYEEAVRRVRALEAMVVLGDAS